MPIWTKVIKMIGSHSSKASRFHEHSDSLFPGGPKWQMYNSFSPRVHRPPAPTRYRSWGEGTMYNSKEKLLTRDIGYNVKLFSVDQHDHQVFLTSSANQNNRVSSNIGLNAIRGATAINNSRIHGISQEVGMFSTISSPYECNSNTDSWLVIAGIKIIRNWWTQKLSFNPDIERISSGDTKNKIWKPPQKLELLLPSSSCKGAMRVQNQKVKWPARILIQCPTFFSPYKTEDTQRKFEIIFIALSKYCPLLPLDEHTERILLDDNIYLRLGNQILPVGYSSQFFIPSPR